jgi:hypothetical protein
MRFFYYPASELDAQIGGIGASGKNFGLTRLLERSSGQNG